MATEGEEQMSNNIENPDEAELVKQLDLQLEELDDDEFQLPPIGELPTLESILNENDPGSVSDDDLGIPPTPIQKTSFSNDGGDTLSVHSRGSSDSRSRTSSERHSCGSRSRRDAHHKTHGSILRHVILTGVAAQLVSAHDRVGAGLPTTMAVGNIICIGTSHGLILVFEPTQALKFCLGSTQLGEQYGSVSALALNHDCTRLLAGFAKGQICVFDLTSSKLLQTISDAHTPFTAVLHLKWTDFPGMAVISDSGGSVFELSIKRTMGLNSNESRCIFSGSRGEVCTIEPLLMSQFRATPVSEPVILAMATISKVIVVSLRPQLKVLFSHPLKASASTLPLLAWQFVVIQMPDGTRVIDPVLAFGREKNVYFYQLTHGSQEELQFIPLQKMSLSYLVQAMAWLNSRTLAVMDTKEHLHVIDVKTQDELETVDLAHLGLVYASAHFKAIATGSNVSKAMALAGERACYHSMVSFGSQVLLLGTKSFQVVTVRTWVDRLDHLVRGGHVREALQLALDIYQDKAQAVVGLKHKKEKRQLLVQEKINELLNQYLDSALEKLPERTNLEGLNKYYTQLVPLCVQVAVGAHLRDLLFGRMWDLFSEDAISRGIFLESLEPYILSDQLADMSPSISQCLLSHHESCGRLQAAEACIVHLQVTSLDLHQAMTLCWTHGLYDAIFYIYTHGMRDFVTPLEELSTVLSNAMDSGKGLTDSQVMLGNKILVYVSSCLAGRAYPRGEIDPEELQQVKHEIFKCITSLHSKNAKPTEQAYPFLRTLLRFDTREFLNVLALAFEEAEFTSELGMIQRQRVVDILLQVMVEGEGFGPAQLGGLFTFIARQMSRQQGAIAVNRQLFDQVLCHLTAPDASSHHEERQTALLELLQEGGLVHYKVEQLLEKARQAGFYRVCEFVYEERGEHEKIVECYLEDKMRKHQVFTYIRSVLSSPQFTDLHAQKIQQQFLKHIKSLLEIDSSRVASLLLTMPQLTPLLPEVTSHLRGEPQLLFNALHALFTYRSTHASPGGHGVDNNDGTLTPELQEEYIDLMCQVNPTQVYAYLKGAEGYRLEQTLEICRQHKQQDSTAFLLERAGDIKGAFDILLTILKSKVDDLLNCVRAEGTTSCSLSLGHVQAQVVKLVRVCQLGSSQLEESGRRELWFPLLDVLLSTQPPLAHDQQLAHEMRGMVGHVVNSMMTHISLPAILERVMHDPGYCDGNFAQIKHLLKGMVERYVYEETLYATVVRIIAGDQLSYLTMQHSQACSPLIVYTTTCAICHSVYHPSSKAVAHSCGHSYHARCGGEAPACVLCTGSSQEEQAAEQSQAPDSIEEPTVGLDDTQLEGIRRVKALSFGGSRLQFLDELSTPRGGPATENSSKTSPSWRSSGSVSGNQDIWSSQNFALKLAPPTIEFEGEANW
ncbi:vacuolar protein sorting-associated protein 8 homolog [Penaeus japonicus]|uniref:vacuolar protein sorting-associated protein 8 homolog n=1 Tax=Penaeus japonicus TaxID=27405 RepID=UPI001C710AAE|nr:vacuolar protein sorting-associated protein 8 homolog [Penaeus japonicus]